ncbi:MAG: ROK family protein [Lactococcus plantarum]|nr:ROK family protein [Lactococcus plantarum]
MLLGSIEAGGTKFVCSVGTEQFEVKHSSTFPTTTPQKTLKQAIDFFKSFDVVAIGIGSFGPIDIIRESKTYGYVMSTPKPYWSDVDMIGLLKKELNVPMYFTTDVNASAYGELIANENQGSQSLVYFTIGTGIGAGAIQKGQFIGGISHAEMGHQFVKRHPKDLEFKGICPFHGDCLEGVASGPSLKARTGISGENISLDSEVWDIQAYYIAQAAISATLTLAPSKIIFGGGVMAQEHMIARVRTHFKALLNDYVMTPPLEDYLQLTSIADNGSATLGNFALALKELRYKGHL